MIEHGPKSSQENVLQTAPLKRTIQVLHEERFTPSNLNLKETAHIKTY